MSIKELLEKACSILDEADGVSYVVTLIDKEGKQTMAVSAFEETAVDMLVSALHSLRFSSPEDEEEQ